MLARRDKPHPTGRAAVILALLVTLPLVAVPWSSARAADDDETPKAAKPDKPDDTPAQVEDSDRPHDKSLLEKGPTDAAVASKAQAEATPFYQTWQFWAITGGAIVGAVVIVLAGSKLFHEANGGDIRPCPTMDACFGQGR